MTDFKFEINKEKLESTMEAIFDSPRELVWRAHTEKELIGQWWGPKDYEITVEEFDAVVGGKWKIIHEKNGERHVFFGEFREIVAPSKITWTFNYEPYPGVTTIETLTMEALPDGKTKITTISHYPSIEALEGMIQSGMEEGSRQTWERLEKMLDEQK